ncbi:hypothetical protein ACP70R_035080 [Stipagrostis hirtigluma subsp. patula]
MDKCSAAAPPAFHASVLRSDKPGCRYAEDAELDVFAAERYFNGDDALYWCARSSSSFSSAFRTGTHERDRSVPTPTAATSSSEASWNSRSALLRDGKALAVSPAAATSAPDAEARPSGVESECGGRKPIASSRSHLRRWLLGVAGCGCAGGDGEESVCADEFLDEVKADNHDVRGVASRNRSSDAGQPFSRTEDKELAAEDATTVKVKPGRRFDDGDMLLAAAAAFGAVQIPRDSNRRGANSFELSALTMNPATTATSDERRRSLQIFNPVGDQGSTLSAANQNSALTIVAGTIAPGAGPRGTAEPTWWDSGDGGEDEAAAPSELRHCAYPPSEASVAWSVVTAEGAASGNFSSAASGYYFYFNDGKDQKRQRQVAAWKGNRRRRSGITDGGAGLLTCMSKKAVDAVGPARSVHRPEVEPGSVARMGAAAGGRNVPDGGYPDVMRRR